MVINLKNMVLLTSPFEVTERISVESYLGCPMSRLLILNPSLSQLFARKSTHMIGGMYRTKEILLKEYTLG